MTQESPSDAINCPAGLPIPEESDTTPRPAQGPRGDKGTTPARLPLQDQKHTLALLAAFAAVYLVWGSTYLAIRFAVATLPPFLMAGVRFILAGSILYLVMHRRNDQPIRASHWISAAIVGSLMLLGGNGLVCWAEQSVPSGITSLIVGTVPLWLIGLDWLVYKGSRPPPVVVVGVAIGLGGIFLLVNPQAQPDERVHLPSALALLAGCSFWSLGSLYSRRNDLPSNAFLSASMQMLTGGCMLILVGTIAGEWPRVNPAAMSSTSILALLYLILVGSLVGLTAYLWLLKNCSPGHGLNVRLREPGRCRRTGSIPCRRAVHKTSRHCCNRNCRIGSPDHSSCKENINDAAGTLIFQHVIGSRKPSTNALWHALHQRFISCGAARCLNRLQVALPAFLVISDPAEIEIGMDIEQYRSCQGTAAIVTR